MKPRLFDLKPKALKSFPWATFGRPERSSDFHSRLEQQRSRADLFPQELEFAIIVVIESPDAVAEAARTWESLRLQSFPRWNAWVVASESLRQEISLPVDLRFHWVGLPAPSPEPWECKNAALERIRSGWVGVLSLGDVLSPTAFYDVAAEIQKDTDGVRGYFTNEVTLGTGGGQIAEFLSKRAWSLPTLAHWNSVGRFWVIRRAVLSEFEPLPAGSDEHVAFLRLSGALKHIPSFLYYRRQNQVDAPGEVVRGAVERALSRSGLTCSVTLLPGEQSRLKVTPKLEPRLVSAVICFRNKAALTKKALDSLMRVHGSIPLEVILVDNDSSAAELSEIEPFLSTYPVPVKLVRYPGPFNYARMHNEIIREHCRGDLLLLLNNDVELSPDLDFGHWAAWALAGGVATAGILLRLDGGGVQHGGMVGRFGGSARLVRVQNSYVEDRLTRVTREVFANTFAAVMIPRAIYDRLGGLRELELVNGFGDVAFCFEAIRRGLHNLYLGCLEGIHQESASRGWQDEYREEVVLEREYPEILQRMLREDIGLNRVPRSESDLSALGQVARSWVREHWRWLDGVKPALKKGLRNAWAPGNNA